MKSSFNHKIRQLPTNNAGNPNKPYPNNFIYGDYCPLFENATFLMLEREESLLGEIVRDCSDLMAIAQQQADEVADDIEQRL